MSGGQLVSVLWPDGASRLATWQLDDDAVADLQLAEIIAAIVADPHVSAGRRASRERYARQVLTTLVCDEAVIAYRQAVLADLLDHPQLGEQLADVLPALEELAEAPRGERFRPSVAPGLEHVTRRLADLELLVDTVGRLAGALAAFSLSSAGLRAVARHLEHLQRTPEFAALERELPGLRATLASVRSATIGVNLGPDLSPESATILELGTAPIEGRRSLLGRLLGGSAGQRGLSPLQHGDGAGPLGRPNPLVRDLRELLGQVIAPVQTALEQFTRIQVDSLGSLGAELAVLLGAARLFERLRAAGLPVCCPTFVARDQRCCEVVDAYALGLALSQLEQPAAVVPNDIRFDQRVGRVWVLTGPNRGGKTTFTRAVGVAQVLFQTGLFVPARSARLSPVDALLTHFPSREDARVGLGRLDLEAERLATIFQRATPLSLILLNEALAGTSALEALDLASGLVRGLRLLGARAIYVTHLHELAGRVDEINATTPGDGTVASLLAEVVEDERPTDAGEGRTLRQRTYRITPRPPRGVSYAAEIAEEHGISFAQIAALLRQRQLA